jgi:C4-dicarboxylate transporter DctM subunit
MMVVIASIANISVGQLFMAGIVPGFLTGIGLMFMCYLYARQKGGHYLEVTPFSMARLTSSFVQALPAMGLPFLIIGGIVGGVFTPTEAAAVAVLYGLIVGVFVHRELKLSSLPKLLLKASAISASVMIILASASIFSWLISLARVSTAVGELIQSLSSDPLVFLLLVNVLLLVVGMFMESIAAMLILVPVLLPLAIAYGIDPVHFSLVVVFNLTIGFVTPPYGIALYVAANIAGRGVMQVASQSGRSLLVLLTVLLLITYVPEIGMWLPDLFFKKHD